MSSLVKFFQKGVEGCREPPNKSGFPEFSRVQTPTGAHARKRSRGGLAGEVRWCLDTDVTTHSVTAGNRASESFSTTHRLQNLQSERSQGITLTYRKKKNNIVIIPKVGNGVLLWCIIHYSNLHRKHDITSYVMEIWHTAMVFWVLTSLEISQFYTSLNF